MTRSRSLRSHRWFDRYLPWGVSPLSLLEVAMLGEIGRLKGHHPEFVDRVTSDSRFVVDDIPISQLAAHAYELAWTRDPIDRLLAAHSAARRVPFLSLDRKILRHHRFLPDELK